MLPLQIFNSHCIINYVLDNKLTNAHDVSHEIFSIILSRHNNYNIRILFILLSTSQPPTISYHQGPPTFSKES